MDLTLCDACRDGVLPELATARHDHVIACTAGLVDHDYRPYVSPDTDTDNTYLRCVWCHAVTCGNADQTDPCIEPYHHRVPHRTRLGATWPIGGDRPNPSTRRNT